ncbi:MAG TPA: formimidoylglutamate deiminase [Candidatus Dormibacteraeota bacterium]|nr:formimidoylglutamate deiminase [Candidatus Dormibacteraeota bacterium]
MTALWFESALLPQGWARRVRVAGSGGLIAQVSAGVEPQPGDERHGVGLPGLPNVHSHAFQRGLAGLTERRGAGADSFWSWRELMYRFVERITPEQFEALAVLAQAEMLEAGFTHVGEFHYLHHDRDGTAFGDPAELAKRLIAAASHTGIGLTLLPTFYAHGGFGGTAPDPRQRRFITNPEFFARIVTACRGAVRGLPGAAVGVAPHSLRAVTPAELNAIVQLAADGPLHIHIAEQTREVEECLAWCGRRPVEWLLENQAVDARWCLVHATHASDTELAQISARDAVVGLCPVTEASLGDGIFPAARFLSQSGRIGIGSDSNVLIDAAEELRTLEYSQRLARRARNVLAHAPGASTGRSLYDAVLAGGQRALQPGAAAASGLVPGASLDLVALAAQHPALLERSGDELIDSWIFAAGRSAVDCVWRAGAKLVEGGRHRDRDAIVARYGRALQQLLA